MSLDKKIENEAQTWLLRVMSDDMTNEEQQEFDIWFNQSQAHQKAYNKAQQVWSKLDILEDDFLSDFETNSNLTEIEQDQSPPSIKNKPAIYQYQWFKQAAAILICVTGLGVYYKDEVIINLTADMKTAQGEQTTKFLSDGTKLTLNTDSAIRLNYSKQFRRIRLLKGEIYLEAKTNANRPLIIETNQGSAKAVGTAFAVQQTSNKMVVTVTEGIVAVTKAGNHSPKEDALLRLNQSISLGTNGSSNQAYKVNASENLAWRVGKIIFKDKPISQALNELDRYFPGKIIKLTFLNERAKINGVFQKDKIQDAIKAVASTQNKTVSFTPGNYLAIIK